MLHDLKAQSRLQVPNRASCDLDSMPAKRANSWTGASQHSSCGGHFSASRDLDASAASTRAADFWVPATGHPACYAPAEARQSTDGFPAPASLIPAGMLSPDNAGPAFAPEHTATGRSAAQVQGRPALCSLPLGGSQAHGLRSPQPSAQSPRTHAHADAAHGMPLRRVSYQSEQSTCDDDAMARGPAAAAPRSAPATTSSAQPCSSAQSSQDQVYCGHEWLAHPEVQASICEMLEEEMSSAVDPNYMRAHSEQVMGEGLWVTPAMRLMTVNWMSEAVDDLDLDQVRAFTELLLCAALHTFRRCVLLQPC